MAEEHRAPRRKLVVAITIAVAVDTTMSSQPGALGSNGAT
jgi:hypothetical protein